jgi:predicted Zn-dependent protease with MMP-like domain
MDFETFSRLAREAFETIPEEFREGVDGLTIRAEALPHPSFPDVYTLGQCLTEAYPSEWSGPDTLRSILVLFHGSFEALAKEDPDFDWDGELWDTLTHELRHHLEGLANEDALELMDHAMEESFRRAEGKDFDPFYYQAGKELGPGLFQMEYDFFLEKVWDPAESDDAETIPFSWHGLAWRIPWPESLGDVHYLWVRGPEVGPGSLQLVLIRKRSWMERVEGLATERDWELWESEGTAQAVP